MILKGKVTANAVETYRLGLASGTVIRIAAGTAMYEALAHKTEKRRALPWGMLMNRAISNPIPALNIGISMANATRKMPVFCKSLILLAATSPISSKKKVNMP